MRPRFNLCFTAVLSLVTISGTWAQSTSAIPVADAQSIATLMRQAENGDANAQFNLGRAYRDGHGIPQDFIESYFWLDLAASQISNDFAEEESATKARDEVATHLTSSVLVETQERARQWFASHQAESHNPDKTSSSTAQGEKPLEHCSPSGSDDAGRVALYTCECNQGNMDGCANLGTYYRMGWGVSKDMSQAIALFKKACDGGSGSGCRLQDAATSSSAPSAPSSPQTNMPPDTSTLSSSLVKPVLRTEISPAIAPASSRPMELNSSGCAKNISFAVAEGGQVVSLVPQFTHKWIEKNRKKYAGLCFSQIPIPQAANYVLVFSNSLSWFNGIFPTVVTSRSTSSSPISGSGTITSNSGSMWNYTYEGTETTTTTTTTPENLPYTDTTSILYVNAYSQDGALISQRWRSTTTRQGGEGANTLGYNLGAALAAIHLKERLLKDAVEDVFK